MFKFKKQKNWEVQFRDITNHTLWVELSAKTEEEAKEKAINHFNKTITNNPTKYKFFKIKEVKDGATS